MADDQKLKTFFPGSKKEIRLQPGGISLLADKRVNMHCVMSLDDGRILGMPGWLSDEYVLIAKQEGGTKKTENAAQLQGVEVRIFANETQEEPILAMESCSLQGFKFVKGKTKKNAALGSIDLHFSISTISFNSKLWKILPDYNAATFYIQFAGTQMTLAYTKAKDSDQDEPEEETKQPSLLSPIHDEAYRKAHPEEFPAQAPKQRRSPAAQKAADVMDGKPLHSSAGGRRTKGPNLVH